jgi:hypothetical protein
MQKIPVDTYVIDILMPDLVGHDRRPASFLVYLYLLRQAARARRDQLSVSLQTMATHTGLAKSTVQSAIRHLRRRRLLDPDVAATSVLPVRAILRPWVNQRSVGRGAATGK